MVLLLLRGERGRVRLGLVVLCSSQLKRLGDTVCVLQPGSAAAPPHSQGLLKLTVGISMNLLTIKISELFTSILACLRCFWCECETGGCFLPLCVEHVLRAEK